MLGIFDSGLGGLSVLNEIKAQLPRYNYIYLGDSARTPYGNKPQNLIYKYTCEGLDFLFREGCELVILACNTASTKALRKIQQEYLPSRQPDKKVLGVLIPVVEELQKEIGKLPKGRPVRTGIIGTKATISSGAYETEIKKLEIRTEVFSKATPLLAPLVEEGWTENKIIELALRKYLRPLQDKKIDYLILGCTHYPFLQKAIEKVLRRKTKIIKTPQAVAAKLKNYLLRHPDIEKKLSRGSVIKLYTTGDPIPFQQFAEKLFRSKLSVERVDIAEDC